MFKPGYRYLYLGLLLLIASPLFAQGGCVDSPENPTVVLGLIGAAGASFGPLKRKLISFFHSRRNR